ARRAFQFMVFRNYFSPAYMRTFTVVFSILLLILQIIEHSWWSLNPDLIASQSYLYILLLISAAIGFGELGVCISSFLFATIIIVFHLKTEILIPQPLVITFIPMSAILFALLIQANKNNIQMEIDLHNLEADINDLTKQINKERNLVRSLKHKISIFSQLRTIGAQLCTHLSLSAIATKTLQTAPLLVEKGDVCSLYLLDSNLKEFQTYEHTILTKEGGKIAIDPQDRFNRWILRNRQPLIVDDLSVDFRFEDDLKSRNLNSTISAPLITDNKLIGALRLASSKSNTFQIEDLRLLMHFSNIISTSIKNSLLYRDTLELAIRDSLTGLFVYKHFHEKLEDAFQQAKKNASSLCVCMIDVDNFKQINDRFGHTVGDSVLKNIADTLKLFIDEKYVPARYGGEEFAAFFEKITPESAKEKIKLIHHAIAKTAFDIRRTKINITASIGLATISDIDNSKDDLLSRADQALYMAKRTGKNKIVADL
ncbi:MAG: sensor domain-containing diguanylate cyclase, partial [Chlamydiota bacterium]|nr:sensor domain-containing diguanylate cyclase [Chlamydiota bacterium]